MPPIEVRALAASGLDALRRGDARKARDSFERITRQGHADAGSLVALAQACRALDDRDAALEAVDKALALEPRNVRALILKADCLAAGGDDRGAAAFYQFAVQAAPSVDRAPADLRAELERASSMCGHYARKFEQFLLERLQGPELSKGPASSRFRQSVDILLGKKNVYFQQPAGVLLRRTPADPVLRPQRFSVDGCDRGRDRCHPGGGGRGAQGRLWV